MSVRWNGVAYLLVKIQSIAIPIKLGGGLLAFQVGNLPFPVGRGWRSFQTLRQRDGCMQGRCHDSSAPWMVIARNSIYWWRHCWVSTVGAPVCISCLRAATAGWKLSSTFELTLIALDTGQWGTSLLGAFLGHTLWVDLAMAHRLTRDWFWHYWEDDMRNLWEIAGQKLLCRL